MEALQKESTVQITQRFRLLVKGRINAVLDGLEDPERSLNQLIIDMEEELESAKRAVASAMANEDRLRAKIQVHDKEASGWQRSAEQALSRGHEEDAREALRRAELAERQRDRLSERLDVQSSETDEVRTTVAQMQDRLEQARSRLELVHAQLRQADARRAVGKVMRRVERSSLHAEFDRISGRAAHMAAAERAYHRLDDELNGDDVRRRFEELDLAHAVEERLARLKGDDAESKTAEPASAPEDSPATAQ
jgi:phage shock protein A